MLMQTLDFRRSAVPQRRPPLTMYEYAPPSWRSRVELSPLSAQGMTLMFDVDDVNQELWILRIPSYFFMIPPT